MGQAGGELEDKEACGGEESVSSREEYIEGPRRESMA